MIMIFLKNRFIVILTWKNWRGGVGGKPGKQMGCKGRLGSTNERKESRQGG